MIRTKAILYFKHYTAAELGPVAQLIHDKMDANAATFPEPTVAMDALQTLITTYHQRLTERASNASAAAKGSATASRGRSCSAPPAAARPSPSPT